SDTGQPPERIFEDSLHDRWYTAREALDYGFIDAVVDDFAQIASEFDTIAELRSSLAERVAQQGVFTQGSAARDKLVETLLEQIEIPVPPQLIEDEVHNHLEGEGRLEDDVHRAEVTEASEKQFRTQVLLDTIAEQADVQVSQEELSQYLVQSAAQYGMAPQEFVEALQSSNQLPALVGEVARNKALAIALGKVKVVDSNGKAVDLSDFIVTDDEAEAEAPAEEKPAKKAPAKKAPAKKADADAEEKPAAKKPAAKKAPAKKAADSAE
ncbi:MAG: ATP-dependent Clp protease proteolytic subunit, partial [Microbacterium sp.]|nr:ATP-dependent Clp protease proteolytic subunit [Microbacterium sp.]